MNKVLDRLPALVDEEYKAAMEQHQPFHSLHEGYAVLLEEVEEAGEELNLVRSAMPCVWSAARYDNAEKAIKWADVIESHAVQLAAEAIQVAAMARKLRSGQTIESALEAAQRPAEQPTGGLAE